MNGIVSWISFSVYLSLVYKKTDFVSYHFTESIYKVWGFFFLVDSLGYNKLLSHFGLTFVVHIYLEINLSFLYFPID